jgi:putative membrane protein
MKLGLLSLILSLALMACQPDQGVQAARENNTNSANVALNDAEKNFIIEAEKGNIKERNLARVVLAKSQNKDVRDYAQMLVDDHTKCLRDLVDLMNKKGMDQPTGLPEVKHEAESKLNWMSGPAFDRKFIEVMIQDRDRALWDFRQQDRMAEDKDLKDYVRKTIPVLGKHLLKAEDVQRKLAMP